MRTISQRLAELLVAWRYPLLAVGIFLAAAAIWPSRQLDFDRSIENMFAPDDPLLPPYKKLKQTFGGNEIVLAVYRDEHLLDPDGSGIRRLARISSRLKQVPGVRAVLSLAEVNGAVERVEQLAKPFARKSERLAIVNPDDDLGRRYQKLFEGYTHGGDGVTTAVVCMLVPENETDIPRRDTVDKIRAVMEDLPDGLAAGMITGEPVMVVDGFRYVEEDGQRLGWSTTLLLALTIILCFRSLRWVLIPLAVVQFSLLLTKATLNLADLELSMVSSMLTAIVTVVGIATVVHIIVRFRDARAGGQPAREALVASLTLLIVPVFWACATDAVGFGSLLVAKVGPVQDFGVMMVIGSMFVLASVALLVPGLTLLGSFDTDPRRAWGEAALGTGLERLIHWVEHHPRTIGVGVVAVVAFMVSGVAWLQVETDFTKNFRSGSPIVRAYQFVETNLGGAGVWDVVLPAPEQLDDAYMQRVRRLEDRLRKIEVEQTDDGADPVRLTKVISLADADHDLEQALQDSRLFRAFGPDSRLRGMSLALPEFTAALRSTTPDADGRFFLRIMLRAPERQSAASKLELIDRVQGVVEDELHQPDWREFLQTLPHTSVAGQSPGEVTGFFVLLTNLIKSMISDQWLCFGVATLGIGLMMLVAFRSPVLALVALVPNALPILMVLGIMGWLGLKINMGAAMIASVSMGLSVDSSIHYITAFRRARDGGSSVHRALGDVQQSVGRAMVFSTIALIVGFTVLCTSNFVPTIYFGFMVSLSMLGGLFGNLLVLPLLLKLVTRDGPSRWPLQPEESEPAGK